MRNIFTLLMLIMWNPQNSSADSNIALPAMFHPNRIYSRKYRGHEETIPGFLIHEM